RTPDASQMTRSQLPEVPSVPCLFYRDVVPVGAGETSGSGQSTATTQAIRVPFTRTNSPVAGCAVTARRGVGMGIAFNNGTDSPREGMALPGNAPRPIVERRCLGDGPPGLAIGYYMTPLIRSVIDRYGLALLAVLSALLIKLVAAPVVV